MSLNINCDICKKELEEPGGLLFSPPIKDLRDQFNRPTNMVVEKKHICVVCYDKIVDLAYGIS